MARLYILAGVLAVLIGSGCRSKVSSNPPSGAPEARGAAKPAPLVGPIDAAGLQTLVTQRKGRILFLNIWATWCAPCVEEFPDLIRLSRLYDGNQVEVVAISADYPDEVNTKITPFLE